MATNQNPNDLTTGDEVRFGSYGGAVSARLVENARDARVTRINRNGFPVIELIDWETRDTRTVTDRYGCAVRKTDVFNMQTCKWEEPQIDAIVDQISSAGSNGAAAKLLAEILYQSSGYINPEEVITKLTAIVTSNDFTTCRP